MAGSNALYQRKSEMHSQSQGASPVEAHVRGIDAKRLRLAQLQVELAFSAFILIGANDGALGVLIPSMRMHYGVDKATIGLLFLFQTIGYLIAAFNSGLLVEKLGNRRFLVLGVVSFLLGVGALSLMPSYLLMLIMMLPLGFGVAIIDAGLNTNIASMPRNAALLNYLHAFYGAGALLGPIYPTTIALISNKASSRILPSAIGFMVSLGSVGAAVCPWLAGMLAEHIGLWSLMPYVILLAAVMVCLWQALQVRPSGV